MMPEANKLVNFPLLFELVYHVVSTGMSMKCSQCIKQGGSWKDRTRLKLCYRESLSAIFVCITPPWAKSEQPCSSCGFSCHVEAVRERSDLQISAAYCSSTWPMRMCYSRSPRCAPSDGNSSRSFSVMYKKSITFPSVPAHTSSFRPFLQLLFKGS